MAIPQDPPLFTFAKRLEALTATTEPVEAAIAAAERRVSAIPADAAFPQDALEAAVLLKALADKCAAAYETIKAAAIAHHEAKGAFQHGRVAINISTSSACRPKWQDEAIEQAKLMADLKGEIFNKDVFLKAVQARYPKTSSTTVKLTVSL